MDGPAIAMLPLPALRANPLLVASMKLLALPAPALERLVETELASNPALERDERRRCPVCGIAVDAGRCPACMSLRGHAPAGRAPVVPAAEPSLADALGAEVALELKPDDRPIAEYLIGSLDDHGFLDGDTGEAAATLGAPAERVERVLRVIQRCGPPGVGAHDVRECLLLQLDRLAADDSACALARRIVAERLEDLAHGRYGEIARAFDADRAAVLAARDLLRARLRPFPTLPASSRVAPPPPPEVLVTARFEVELLEPRRLCVGVSPAYERLDRDALAPAERVRTDAQLARARSFLDRLDRRWRTIRAVAELLVDHQHAFVARGPAALRPLTRRQVADTLGFHESTVSRAVADRHALLPSGRVVPLAAFFEAAAGPRDALARLIASEPRPLSDDELAARLARAGHPLARRTVAKYRGQLGIPAHALR